MSTQSQIAANQANAQHSSGPKTAEGKAISCLNNFRHGFTGEFNVLPSEDQEQFDTLYPRPPLRAQAEDRHRNRSDRKNGAAYLARPPRHHPPGSHHGRRSPAP